MEKDSKFSTALDLMPCSYVKSFPLADDLLLFDAKSKQLFRLNSTAALVWNACGEGMELEEIVALLSEATGVGCKQISEDVEHVISQWSEIGLFQSTRPLKSEQRSSELYPSFLSVDYRGPIPHKPSNRHQLNFRILDTSFRLSVSTDRELQLLKPIVGHLAVPDSTQYDEQLYITATDKRYLLVHNNHKVIDWCEHVNGIAPMLHGNALVIAYESAQCIFGLHAAAVQYQEKNILMPGTAGSGKSTLTAALVGSGFTLCADDLVLLTPSPVRMRPVPVTIGLKTGSWPLLTEYYTNIDSLPVHLRADNKHIRYLVPPSEARVSMFSQPLPIDRIVFPKFTSGIHSTDVEKISAAEGLCSLTDAGYDVHGEMNQGLVQQLVDWIAGIPCFRLSFNRLDNAVDTIISLVT